MYSKRYISFTLYELASLYTRDLTAEPGICGLASQTKIARPATQTDISRRRRVFRIYHRVL